MPVRTRKAHNSTIFEAALGHTATAMKKINFTKTNKLNTKTNYVTPPVISNLRQQQMSRFVRKPAFCICENKDPDQLCGNCEADQRLCFRYIDSTIPLLSKSEISSL